MSGKIEVKNILSSIPPATVTIDDNATPAMIVYLYEGGPETLKYLFYILGYDIVVTIYDPAVSSRRWIQDVPEHHVEAVEVVVTTIDKPLATGTKLQRKMRAAIRTVVETGAHGLNFILRMPSERPQGRRKGGLDRVWETKYIVEYWDA